MEENKINVGPDIKKAKHKYLLGILGLYNLPMLCMISGEDFKGGQEVVDIILIYGNLVIVIGYFLIYFV